ncbi:hypothetical protein GCM10022415_04540 [Knoellia locipacati]|uniref:D-inositol 3-phosphate glycosyltransferase n=1 Tax=Knoellia locipacati TaxID=882824 RepID=A0A512SWX2_9MICO|nr:glycosyltransferase [Knoellia locipacati]GEQ12405.1 hypothetical protein KLO01_04520 [Knoellia locipacati]
MRNRTAQVDPNNRDADVVVITFDSYPLSTRSRKAARAYAEAGMRVQFVGMSRAGRTGRWSPAGRTRADGIDILSVDMRAPDLEPTRLNIVRNVALTYVPAIFRMAKEALGTPAGVVHTTGSALSLLGVAHKVLHRSKFVLDIPERPGAVAARGSAAAAFARVERIVLRAARPFVDVASVVVEPDVHHLRDRGFDDVVQVRNAPMKSWLAPYVDMPPSPVRFAVIGSIFEGRGYETLIRAAARAQKDANFQIYIYGKGRDSFTGHLKNLSSELGADRTIVWAGSLPSDQVSRAYLDAHVGVVLYESLDPGNDGLSNKLLECIASGRPVLAGDLPENRKFVTQHQAGWLTDVSEEALAHSIVEVANTTIDLDVMGQHCRDLGETALTWEGEFAPIIERMRSTNSASAANSS